MTAFNSKTNRRHLLPHSWLPGFLSGFLAGVSLTAIIAMVVTLVLTGSILVGAPLVNGFDEVLEERTPRNIGDIRKDMKAFIKNSKQDLDQNLQIGAIVDLCALHRQIVVDPRFENNRSLQSLRAQTAQRLKTFKKALQLQLKRHERTLAKHRLKSVPNEIGEETSLSDLANSNDDPDYLNEAMTASMFELMDTTGGPAQLLNYLPGNFAPPWDHGEDLVRLIESTIHPSSWRNRGGNGVIEYYRPLRVLVVSATSRVHDDTTNLLRNMRWMNR